MVAIRFLFWMALAFICESMVEYLFASWIAQLPAKWKWVDELEPLKYISLLVGVALAASYGLDIIYEVFGATASWPQVGVIVTGLTIGRGSNYCHDFWSRYLKPPAQVTLVGDLTAAQTTTVVKSHGSAELAEVSVEPPANTIG